MDTLTTDEACVLAGEVDVRWSELGWLTDPANGGCTGQPMPDISDIERGRGNVPGELCQVFIFSLSMAAGCNGVQTGPGQTALLDQHLHSTSEGTELT